MIEIQKIEINDKYYKCKGYILKLKNNKPIYHITPGCDKYDYQIECATRFNGHYGGDPKNGSYVYFENKKNAKKAKQWLENKIILSKMGVEYNESSN
jgi:hypothetical protein